jgi:hypothetical protein
LFAALGTCVDTYAVDETLREFVTQAGLPVPDDLWDRGGGSSHALLQAIDAWPDAAARDALFAKLMASVVLSDAPGQQALFQMAASHSEALAGLVACQSDVHRSFWLAIKQPALFEQACEMDYLERHSSQVQQHDLNVRLRPDISETALSYFRQAISVFYQRELRCGDGCVACGICNGALCRCFFADGARQRFGHAAAGV